MEEREGSEEKNSRVVWVSRVGVKSGKKLLAWEVR